MMNVMKRKKSISAMMFVGCEGHLLLTSCFLPLFSNYALDASVINLVILCACCLHERSKEPSRSSVNKPAPDDIAEAAHDEFQRCIESLVKRDSMVKEYLSSELIR
jgi:hypothetical protein